jgi:putative pyruvate formate lyase activating enzyme
MSTPTSRVDERFLIDDYEPVYLRTWREGGFETKVEAALDELADCKACPRDCGVNRLLDERGVCHTGRRPYVASAFHHFGEHGCGRDVSAVGDRDGGVGNIASTACESAGSISAILPLELLRNGP